MNEKMKKRVDAAWDKLESLMTKLDPEQLKVLRPPATKKQIDTLSETLGINLPPALRYSLMRHDGCVKRKSFLCFEFYSAEKIAKATAQQIECYRVDCKENKRSDPLREGGWSDQSIIIGTSGAGYELVLECENCEKGIPHFYAPNNYSMPLNRDLISYLEGLVLCLEEGSYEHEEGSSLWLIGWGERTANS